MSALARMAFDPEALIVKGGVLALAALSVIRLVWSDFNKMRADFRRGRKRKEDQ
jgi:hypothetical protein